MDDNCACLIQKHATNSKVIITDDESYCIDYKAYVENIGTIMYCFYNFLFLGIADRRFILLILLSHPGIPGWLYVFVPVRTPPPPAADSCSRDNFCTTFWISFIFHKVVGPDPQITWLDCGRFPSSAWPWIFKVKYGICYISPQNGRLPRNEKQTYRLKSRAQMWPSGLTLAMTLTLNLQHFHEWFVPFHQQLQFGLVTMAWKQTRKSFNLWYCPQISMK